jgi:hypothetical protein
MSLRFIAMLVTLSGLTAIWSVQPPASSSNWTAGTKLGLSPSLIADEVDNEYARLAYVAAEVDNTPKISGWRVIWNSEPSTAATISWNSNFAGTIHQVRYGIQGEKERTSVTCQRSGQYTAGSSKRELYYHHARLTDLKPGTAYEFEIESDTLFSPKMYFITAPADDRSFSLLFGGDSRTDQKARQQVNKMIARLTQETTHQDNPAREIIAFAHGGDYVTDGGNLPMWEEWMTDHQLVVAADGRLLPLVPTRGNHDGGPIFNEVFDFPVTHKNYYAVELSPQVQLVTLNTQTVMGGDQQEWLELTLTELRPKSRWLLTQYHQPAWPAVKTPSGALKFWVPLFEEFNVDLALEADGHCIKRTVPIRDGQHDPTGVVYVGEGGLGVKQRLPKSTRWFLQPPGMSDAGHHVQLVSFQPETLEYRVILLDGTERDRYVRPVRVADQK